MKALPPFYPVTATPYRHDEGYFEAAPCPALRPWVRCFWGGLARRRAEKLVIPDACMDLLLTQDEHGAFLDRRFCAISNSPFLSHSQPGALTFAVRFYPWAAAAFAQEALDGTKNGSFPIGQHFGALAKELCSLVGREADFDARKRQAETILLAHLRPERLPASLLTAMDNILLHRGAVQASQLARDVYLSQRQLERLFQRHVGASPKALCSMVRYQCLWREALSLPRLNVQDAVVRYGYVDQAHLLNDFRAFHSMPLREALQLARKDVAFLQANAGEACYAEGINTGEACL